MKREGLIILTPFILKIKGAATANPGMNELGTASRLDSFLIKYYSRGKYGKGGIHHGEDRNFKRWYESNRKKPYC